jgi:magnesium chelatase family protein
MRRRYRDRISGPVRDRIDIHRVLTAPSRPELARALGQARSTADLAGVVGEARQRQRARLRGTGWVLNSDVPGVELRKHWPVSEAGRSVLDHQLRAQRLSARSADRVLRLAWSVADLRAHNVPDADDVELALALRRGSPLGHELRDLVAAS